MKPITLTTSRRPWLATATLLGAALLAGTFLWPQPPGETVDAPMPAEPAPLPDPRRALDTTFEHVPEAPLEPPANTYAPAARLPRSERLSMDDVEDPRLYGLSSDLFHFVDIHSKAVLSSQDIDEAMTLASDRGLIDEAAFELGRHDPGEQQALARRRRIVLVDYLTFALARGNEPAYVARAISNIVLQGSTAEGEPIEIRKTFAGDRIELLAALQAYAPEAFEELRARTAGTPAERLVAYAASLASQVGREMSR